MSSEKVGDLALASLSPGGSGTDTVLDLSIWNADTDIIQCSTSLIDHI